MTWTAWEPAPAVLVGAGLTVALFAQAFVRMRRRGRLDHAGWSRAVLFVLAVALGTLPLVSPLDAVGDSYLLSGHMLQHVLIGDAAPALALVALRGPLMFFLLPTPLLRSLSRIARLRAVLRVLLRPSVSLAAWLLVIGAWHVPDAYDYALGHETVHDLEHVSFMLVGVLVWMQIVDPARRRHLSLSQRIAYMLALSGAGAVLAAVLVVASAPLYPAYADIEVRPFGISALRDQQLAGIVMIGEQLAALGLCSWFMLRAEAGYARRAASIASRRLSALPAP